MSEFHHPLKVFLSYASQDRPLVRELSRRLVGEGWIETWVDEKSLLPGQDWRVKIEEAVEEADVVIICLSNHSVSKEGHVQKELRYAREIALEKPDETIFLIPLRLDECDVPRGLRFYQWVDYFGDAKNNSYDALVKSLKLRYEQKLRLEEIENSREEKVRLEVEELARQKKEKVEREDAEKVAQEKVEKEIQRRLEKSVKKARRDLWWGKLKTDINYRLELIWIYRVPILILLVSLAVIIPLSLDLANKIPESSQTLNKTPISTAALTAQLIVPSHTSKPSLKPTETLYPSKTLAVSVTPTAIPLPVEIIDPKGITMQLVPAGEFTMGSDVLSDEKPVHQVYLDAFYMDKYEVTNAAYKACVDSGVCTPPRQTNSFTRPSYYGNSEFDEYPVIYVDWNQAKTYCEEWRDPSTGSGQAGLPTEAQWEKSARGTDAHSYPWGEGIDKTLANYNGYVGDTTQVGSYESGKSPYGIYDLAGNVWEWVADWYDSNYYANSPFSNPLGPSSGQYHVLRGGSWSNFGEVRSVYRLRSDLSSQTYNSIGFRCVHSP